jgi:hypothetical protein
VVFGIALSWQAGQSQARASGTAELHDCVRDVIAQTRAAGARPEPVRTVFMLTGDSQVFSQRLDGPDCVGFLVAGARQVQSLELVLQDAEGHALAHSAKPASWAYAEHCGLSGDVVFATVRMLDGQGEVLFVPLHRAGPHPAALRSLEECSALGTPRPAPVDVGPEPPGRSIEEQLEVTRRELAPLGYGNEHVVAAGTLLSGQHDANGLVLRPSRCYAIVAAGSDEILDLDLRIFGPTLPLTEAGSDLTRRRLAEAKLCARAPGRYVIDVSAFQGEGAYAVAVLPLTEPAAVPGIVGQARIAYAEIAARMQARGMRTHVVTTGIISAAEQLAVPVDFVAGECRAIGALDSSGREPSGLQLGLESEHGELLALDGRPGEPPLVFHCAQQPERVQAVVRTLAARSPARFVLLLGEDKKDDRP